MKHNIIILLSLLLVVFSCDKEDPYIKIEQTNLHLSSVGGLRTISFVSNKGWTANSSAQWCRVSSGSGDASMSSSIEVTVDANDTYEKRSCTVTITVGGVSNVATITQDAKTGIIVSKARYELLNNAETIVVEVKSNIHFDVNISKEAQKWITQVDTRGLSETTLMFDIAKNESYGNREGTITFSESFGDLKDVVQVFQSQEDAIILSKNRYNLTENAHKLDVEVKSNVDYKVIIPKEDQEWVSYVETRALRSETVVLAVAKNVGYNARSSEIYIKDIATNVQDTLTIIQDANPTLFVAQDEYIVSDKETVIEVEVVSNVEFDITISDDWISEIKTRDMSESMLQFRVTANDSYADREATITFSDKNNNLESVIKVYQTQNDGIIISDEIIDISSESQIVEVELKTNLDEFEIVIPEDAQKWISHIETRSLKTRFVVLSISNNQAFIPRSAKVYIKDKNSNLQEAITIIQRENFDFDYDLNLLCDGEWRATLVRGNKRWDLTTPVNELYNEPTYLKFDIDGTLTSEGAFGKGVGRYTSQGMMINTYVGNISESFEVVYLDENTAKIMVNASLFHLPQITSYWDVVEVTLTKNYVREIDFDYGIENLYGRWRATSIDRAINNKGEDVFDRSVNLTTPDMEDEIAPSYITFEAGGELFIEGIFGEGGGRYTTRGVTFYILTDKNELSEVETTALDGNIAKIRVDLDKVGFNFGRYQGTLDSWKVKIVTLTLTKQADK